MKIIVTHASPDWDAITSVWVLKRFLPGWENADVQFVPAGQRLPASMKYDGVGNKEPIEKIEDHEVLHVDTGMGPLDHHQTSNDTVCGASLSWQYAKKQNPEFRNVANLKEETQQKIQDRIKAVDRIINVVIAIDHFKEVFWPESNADYQEFSLFGVLEGLKMQKPNQDSIYIDFGMQCLDALVREFENRIWAEREMQTNGKKFTTKFGKAIGIETINDTVIKLAQKMGYMLVVRKDPRKGYVRIKARPGEKIDSTGKRSIDNTIDLTPVYETLQKIDPHATWYLHVSKKMLLNGTPKNPKMVPTKLSLDQIIEVLKNV